MGVTVTEKIIQTTKKQKRWTCDICGSSSTKNNGCCGSKPFQSCELCNRLVCVNHQYIVDGSGDYPEAIYCIECWEIGYTYRVKLIALENQYDDDCEQTHVAWKEAAIEALMV